MMKVLRDPLGRPINRLYFKAEVLDERCERKIADFIDRHGNGFWLPIPTSEIIRMIVKRVMYLHRAWRDRPARVLD